MTALVALALPVTAETPREAGSKLPQAAIQIVLVLDGLRPDSITPAITTNLDRLRSSGVQFENTHTVFPTVTRVNSASLGTGVYPNRHGSMGNSIYVPAVDPLRPFSNDDFNNLMKLDAATSGRMMTVSGLAETMQRAGRRMAVVSSGSTGSAILLMPKAASGDGMVINGDFLPGKKVAYPDAVSDLVLQRFGPAPIKCGAKDRYDASVVWSMRVVRDYVLPEVKPDVLFIWMTDPDHIQHGIGVGDNAASGNVDSSAGNHGGVRPWTMRNTMLAKGPDFKHGAMVRTPTSNVDVTPTLLHLLGMDAGIAQLDGRTIT